MKRITIALFVFISLIINCLSAQVQLGLTEVQSGFNRPVDIDHAGDERLFIAEQNGRIRIIGTDGNLLSEPFLNLNLGFFSGGDERGLLGVAFHPNYSTNGFVFVNFTNASGNTVIARFTTDPLNPDKVDMNSQKIILTINQPFSNHNGGDIKFGPDGYLYIATGDGGSANDPFQHGQNRLSLLGKMLRIDVDKGDPYSIPPDNPFAEDDFTLDEIWALGLRNPWRFSFDRLTGDLWIGDVGQGDWEEIDFQPAGSTGGENYGWNCYEGNLPFSNMGPCADALENYVPPIFDYPSDRATAGCSVTGGYVYRGQQFPDLSGKYIYADYCSGRIWGLYASCEGMVNQELMDGPNNNFSSFGEDAAGELYLASLNEGKIYKLSAAICSGFTVCLDIKDESCEGAKDGEVQIDIIGGSPPYTMDTSELSNLTAGSYSAIVSDANGCSQRLAWSIGTKAAPKMPIIEPNGDTLFVNNTYNGYQWYLDENLIEGATNSFLIIPGGGSYSVEVFNVEGCSIFSDPLLLSSLNTLPEIEKLELKPNPFFDQIKLSLTFNTLTKVSLKILNIGGVQLWAMEEKAVNQLNTDINVSQFPAGIYFLQIQTERGTTARKLIKQ